jgi:hypothetical protein
MNCRSAPKSADNFGQFVPDIRLSPGALGTQYVQREGVAVREHGFKPCSTSKLT